MGGVSKPVRLALIDGSKCLHFIGTTTGHICLKVKKEGSTSCGTSHRGGRFQLEEPTLVIRAGVSLAYASPAIKASKLEIIEGVTVEDWLSDQSITTEGWGQHLAILKHASAEMVDDMSHLLEVVECLSPLATPWKSKGIHSNLVIHDPECNYQEQIDNDMYAHLED